MPWVAKVRDLRPLEAVQDNSFPIAFADYLKGLSHAVGDKPPGTHQHAAASMHQRAATSQLALR